PKLRVIVQSDVSEAIQKGGNVFAKHVVDCDPSIVPYSEVIVVNEADALLAIGKALLMRDEMLHFKKGIAVKIRKGV
ncbi:MAG TPA: PUA domain-containing protein, partial [Methanosarcinales archaeon]|nr:PUA domain-containing protein [Methanosarcinales archaeon]